RILQIVPDSLVDLLNQFLAQINRDPQFVGDVHDRNALNTGVPGPYGALSEIYALSSYYLMQTRGWGGVRELGALASVPHRGGLIQLYPFSFGPRHRTI